MTLRELREARERAARGEVELPGEAIIYPSSENSEASAPILQNNELTSDGLLAPTGNYFPYGIPIPNRPGFVLSPYTNTAVNVRGVESGRLVFDERDPANRNEDGTRKNPDEMPHKFRVP